MTRRHPWRDKHPDAVIVARPTKWGNRFRLGDMAGILVWTGGRFEGRWGGLVIDSSGTPGVSSFPGDDQKVIIWAPILDRIAAVALFSAWLAEPHQDGLREAARRELRGKDLACWCPLGQPCHADVLLETANG
jgi:hypothetical protein